MASTIKWLMHLATAGLLLITGVRVVAAELDHVDVTSDKNRFYVESVATLHAPIDAVYDTLIDFDNYEKISSVYNDAKWMLQNADGSGEIYTYTRGCILFFCRGFARVETVEVIRPTSIITRVDAERSQGSYGVSTWLLEDSGDDTIINFEFAFEPNFWVPPGIGPYFIKRMLRKNGAEALERIEALAIERHNTLPTAHSDETGELIMIPGQLMKDVADVDAVDNTTPIDTTTGTTTDMPDETAEDTPQP